MHGIHGANLPENFGQIFQFVGSGERKSRRIARVVQLRGSEEGILRYGFAMRIDDEPRFSQSSKLLGNRNARYADARQVGDGHLKQQE